MTGSALSLVLAFWLPWFWGPWIWIFLAVSVLGFGIVTLVAGIMLYVRPARHVAWGVVVLVFSALGIVGSMFLAMLGLVVIVGAILGIVGGALGIAWQPWWGAYPQPYAIPPPTYAPWPAQWPGYGNPYAGPPVATSVCRNCGSHLVAAAAYCARCGAKV